MTPKDRQLFDLVVGVYERDTMFNSFTDDGHPYYRAIVAWGRAHPKEIITWLLEHISDHWHWCQVLWELVGEKEAPHIPDEMAGRADYIEKAWLNWGRANGYLRAKSK